MHRCSKPSFAHGSMPALEKLVLQALDKEPASDEKRKSDKQGLGFGFRV